jgi:2-oxoglutarate ferredoxin oxidoreductase subunit alpha
MHDKRMRKLKTAEREIPESEQIRFFGPEQADVTIVSWGSPKGAIIDAMPELDRAGIKINFLQVHVIWPFPAGPVTRILSRAKTVVGVEMNYSGQLCDLIRRETGIEIKHRVVKFNGRPISQTEIVNGIAQIHKQKSERVVLTSGL